MPRKRDTEIGKTAGPYTYNSILEKVGSEILYPVVPVQRKHKHFRFWVFASTTNRDSRRMASHSVVLWRRYSTFITGDWSLPKLLG